MKLKSIASAIVVLSASALPTSAQAITGRLVDSNGFGVPGVDIDAIDVVNGDPVDLANDGTNATGDYTTTVLDGAGLYTFTFRPPPPPTTTLLILEVPNIVVSGTVNLGTRTMTTGVSLSGVVRNVSNSPLAGVHVDIVDQATGALVLVQGNVTNAFGSFTMAVPTTPIQAQFRPDGLIPTLAPRVMDLTLSSNTNLGTVTLQPGFTLSGTVRKAGGLPVAGADMDVFDSSTGDKLLTPDDNTNASGVFGVIVPAGNYTVEACPPSGSLLVGAEVLGVVVSGNTNLGIITLQNGVVLSGTIRDFLGATVQNADVDARNSSTGVGVVLCGDNSNASGAYSVVVPTGTFDITFSPPSPGCATGLGLDKHLGVVIGGNTVLNGTLPDLPTATTSVWAGDGINADTITPVNASLGSSWSAPLTIGHAHGASGFLSLEVRTTTLNGANFHSPVGGRLTELLIGGTFLGRLSGVHNGVTGNVAAQLLPNDISIAGRAWSAQYTVVGGGHADFSRAVSGIVGCP